MIIKKPQEIFHTFFYEQLETTTSSLHKILALPPKQFRQECSTYLKEIIERVDSGEEEMFSMD